MAGRTDIVEIKKSWSGNTAYPKYYFNRKSPNGQIISTSELYSTRSNARRGAKRANPDLANSQFKNV